MEREGKTKTEWERRERKAIMRQKEKDGMKEKQS